MSSRRPAGSDGRELRCGAATGRRHSRFWAGTATGTMVKFVWLRTIASAQVGMALEMDWLMWAPLASACLHISEEFFVPGGFPAWYRRYRTDPSRINHRLLVIVNAVLLAVCCDVALLGRTSLGIAYWLAISALLCSNGCWHAWASFKSHPYSPGVVTGVAVYIPLAIYGYSQFVRSGAASFGTAVVAALIGGSYQQWSAAYHRPRPEKSAK